MSHKKAKDARTDCIFRYKDSQGQLVCSNYGYKTSDEYLKWFGFNPFFDGHLRGGKIEYSGGFILGGDSVITKCCGCCAEEQWNGDRLRLQYCRCCECKFYTQNPQHHDYYYKPLEHYDKRRSSKCISI